MAEPVDLSFATRPGNIDAPGDLLQELSIIQRDLVHGDENIRQTMLVKARTLVHSLQTPREIMVQHTWAGDLEEVGQDEYRLSSFTKSLTLYVIGDGYLALFGGIGRSPIEFYKFVRQTQWKNPTDASHTAMHVSYDTKVPNCFEYLRPIGSGPQTNNHMGGYRQGRLPWMHPSLYAVEKTLFPGSDQAPDAPLLVDVAGGLGHDIHGFKKFYPEHPGILHNWPDDVCRKILARLAEAMKPGYSKLLIFECVIPRTGAYWEATAGDILMMTQLSALERTEDNWYQLIEQSGLNLKIVKFWKCGVASVENLIECELV
ncbi:hypothetical protein CEK26_010250 [Fusarium fujikuroi]|nr:hypothetical protein CEK26_010250 [Fusarium fujikuroi]SCN84046.1 related to O-methyltransferase [Fusarium fujikuroi]